MFSFHWQIPISSTLRERNLKMLGLASLEKPHTPHTEKEN